VRLIMDYDDDDIGEFDMDDLIDIEIFEPVGIAIGLSIWSPLVILLDGMSNVLHTAHVMAENMKLDIAYMHNKSVESKDFMGSVKAGLERL
jgi:hypothetical protein